jgi:hypothetical protein
MIAIPKLLFRVPSPQHQLATTQARYHNPRQFPKDIQIQQLTWLFRFVLAGWSFTTRGQVAVSTPNSASLTESSPLV